MMDLSRSALAFSFFQKALSWNEHRNDCCIAEKVYVSIDFWSWKRVRYGHTSPPLTADAEPYWTIHFWDKRDSGNPLRLSVSLMFLVASCQFPFVKLLLHSVLLGKKGQLLNWHRQASVQSDIFPCHSLLNVRPTLMQALIAFWRGVFSISRMDILV